MISKEVNQEISRLVRTFDIKYGKAVAPFIPWLLDNLKKLGKRTIKQVVDKGWSEFDIEPKISNSVVDNAVEGAIIKAKSKDPEAIIDERALRGAINDVAWASDQVDLRNRNKRANTSTRRYMAKAIKIDLEYTSNYDQNLKKINAHITKSGQVDEKFLRKRVRRMTQDIRSLGFEKDYEKDLRALEREIKDLAEMNYPSSETKRAYERFIKSVRGKNIESFEKSVENMVKTKARYISRRIARTETARSQLDTFLAMSKDDDDVTAYRWRLDASHDITDICDIHAKADHGLGVGVFPKNKLPPMPAHPNCICYFTEVVDDELDMRDFSYVKGGNDFVNKLSTKKQNEILGSRERGDAFRNGENWDKSIILDSDLSSIQSRFDKAIKSKFIKGS